MFEPIDERTGRAIPQQLIMWVSRDRETMIARDPLSLDWMAWRKSVDDADGPEVFGWMLAWGPSALETALRTCV